MVYIYLDQYHKFKPKVGKYSSPMGHMCQGLNSHYFHIIRDGHQPNSRVCIPIIRIPIEGGMTIPNIATFDHRAYGYD